AARTELAGPVARHGVSALVSEGLRRHRDEHVIGQQGHQRVEVGRLPRAGEQGHDRVLGGRASGGGGGGGRGGGGAAARGGGGGWCPAAGCCRRCRLARARLRALLTDWTVTSSMPATSLARNPRTSRKM